MITWWEWQHRALGWLLGWGIGSTVVGAGMVTANDKLIRNVGMQAVAWGAIDALLAWNGQRSARTKAQTGTSDAEQQRDASRFQKIVAVNAGLDVGYMLGGWQLIRRVNGDLARRGTGWGIIVQGAFLCVYDTTLAVAIGRWRARA